MGKVSLGIFLCFQLTKQLNLGDTMAAELAAVMIGTSDKAVHDWRSQFFENDSKIGQRASKANTGDLAYCERVKTSTRRPPDSLGGMPM